MMELNRRGFLGAMLAAAAAPAIVRASSLMPIYIPQPQILTLWGDGVRDDTDALQAAIRGQRVKMADGTLYAGLLSGSTYRVSRTIVVKPGDSISVSNCQFDGRDLSGDGPVFLFKSEAEFNLQARDIYTPQQGSGLRP